jgi:GDPmannose 4,6-dehydratase
MKLGLSRPTAHSKDRTVIEVDARFFRPAEVELLLINPEKARTELGWDPKKCTGVESLCEEMVEADIEMASDPTAYLKF